MKERPILFSGPMVRAIIEGRKTQTRRVVKPQPPSWAKYPQPVVDAGWDWTDRDVDADDLLHWPNYLKPLRCPYGVPGDRLWVRETWNAAFVATLAPGEVIAKPESECERDNGGFACACGDGIVYRADGEIAHPEMGEALWRPSIHMPRWASRITLEIVAVRVERLQEITEDDALAEGALQFDSPTTFARDGVQSIYLPNMGYALSAFRDLWDSINAKRAPWSSNPWVWVIEFRRAGE